MQPNNEAEIQSIVDAHLHDLRTARRDVLEDYIEDSNADWVYTEESVTQAITEGNAKLGPEVDADPTDAMYLECMKRIHAELVKDGVRGVPPALR